jgi:hypothetical protein
MKVTIPNELKATVPQTKWGKILMTTPVIMTILATLLAGLASSEMTRAQYDRSLAAQQQSKAGDQWSYFQAKRLRGGMQRSTLDILQATSPVRPFNLSQFKQAAADLPDTTRSKAELQALLNSSLGQQTLALLESGELPETPVGQAPDKQVESALNAIETTQPEAEIAGLVAPIKVSAVNELLRAGLARVQTFDALLKPFNQSVDKIESLLSPTAAPLNRDFIAARLRYTGLRYDAESRLNQAIANLYELQVRQSNISAERHHRRSQRFFFGMLGAQAAVIISTFSIAAQKRSLLWSLAAAAGLAAVAFAIYVYFYI